MRIMHRMENTPTSPCEVEVLPVGAVIPPVDHTAAHARIARRELARALHWHRHFADAHQTIRAHAVEAGKRAYWSGHLYLLWQLISPAACAVPEIWEAFRGGWFGAQDEDGEVVS
jgi:hypothetical protein